MNKAISEELLVMSDRIEELGRLDIARLMLDIARLMRNLARPMKKRDFDTAPAPILADVDEDGGIWHGWTSGDIGYGEGIIEIHNREDGKLVGYVFINHIELDHTSLSDWKTALDWAGFWRAIFESTIAALAVAARSGVVVSGSGN